MATTPSPPPLKFTGHKHFAQRLVLATLTGRPIRISQIRSSSPTAPGLAPHEVSLLRLIEAVTNGSHIELSYTGTTVLYRPGLIAGSGGSGSTTVTRHELPADNTRGASYFLVPLCQLAPFSKTPFNILLTGPGVITSATTTTGDISVDTVRTAILPLYQPFGILRDLELRILRRSNPGAPTGRGGGGEVQLLFPHQVRLPTTLHQLRSGRVRRIRGVAYATGVAGANNARSIEAARGVLNPLAPDVYIFSDVSAAPFVPAPSSANGGTSNAKRKTGLGFGLSLVAETNTGVLYSADTASSPAGGDTPEDIGRRCALQLLDAVAAGGCVGRPQAATVLMLMAMGSEDVGRVCLGRDVLADEGTLQLARDLRTFGMSGWGLKESDSDDGDGEVIVSIVGRGVGNVGRKIA